MKIPRPIPFEPPLKPDGAGGGTWVCGVQSGSCIKGGPFTAGGEPPLCGVFGKGLEP